jgi:hypothetical protein
LGFLLGDMFEVGGGESGDLDDLRQMLQDLTITIRSELD